MFDLLIIGGGPGGYVSAIKAAQLGLNVALVEKKDFGGTCLNRGCIPTKTLLHAAETFARMKEAAEIGINCENISFDYSKIFAEKEAVSLKLRSGIDQLLTANKITKIKGEAKIISATKVQVGGEIFDAKNILIATGSIPAMPPIEGINLPNVVNSDGLLAKNDGIYKRLLIIGGGVIGIEFAGIFSALGSQITVVEALDRIMPTMDREISQNATMILKKEGINILTSTKVLKIQKSENILKVIVVGKDNIEQEIIADGVLVAVGRRSNTAGLIDESVGVQIERGSIVVDESFKTNVPSIYAIGDATKTIQLAHVASAQGAAVAEIISGKKPDIDLKTIPACIYTNPEIASVGINADEAQTQGKKIKIGKFIMSANGKSILDRQKRGFIKLVFDEESEILLGAQLMCGRATDMIGELALAVSQKMTRTQLATLIHAHPTFAEGILEAIEDAGLGAVHSMPKRKLR